MNNKITLNPLKLAIVVIQVACYNGHHEKARFNAGLANLTQMSQWLI